MDNFTGYLVGLLIGLLVICIFLRLSSDYENSKQTTFCYCPDCENELCSSKGFISDVNGIVTYMCPQCCKVIKWDFDTYPFPFLIEQEETCAKNHIPK